VPEETVTVGVFVVFFVWWWWVQMPVGDVVMKELESSQHGIAFNLKEPGFMPHACLLPSKTIKEDH
jgi:hypothetical protein